MSLPANLTTITVTGTYIDIAGNPIAGQVRFTPRAVLKNVTSNIILINSSITVTLDSNGAFSQALVATDDVDAAPLDFTYQVEEAFIGGRTYDILLPSATVGGTLDLADVAPALPDDGSNVIYIDQSTYDALEARVVVVEGLSSSGQVLNTYIRALENILDNKGSVNSLLFPVKAL